MHSPGCMEADCGLAMGDRAKEDDHEFEELFVIVSRVFPEQLILGEAATVSSRHGCMRCSVDSPSLAVVYLV